MAVDIERIQCVGTSDGKPPTDWTTSEVEGEIRAYGFETTPPWGRTNPSAECAPLLIVGITESLEKREISPVDVINLADSAGIDYQAPFELINGRTEAACRRCGVICSLNKISPLR